MLSPDERPQPDQSQDRQDIHEADLDDVNGGLLGTHPEFRGHGVQPDGGASSAHN